MSRPVGSKNRPKDVIAAEKAARAVDPSFFSEPKEDEEDPREAIPDPTVVGPAASTKRKYVKKRKEGEPRPMSPTLIGEAVDGILLGVSGAYVMVRGVNGEPQLQYDEKKKVALRDVVAEWGAETGFMLPMYLQVCLAGAACVLPAILVAEGQRKAILAGRSHVVPSRPRDGAPQAIRPAPAHPGNGQAGVGQDVVHPKLDPEPGAPAPGA